MQFIEFYATRLDTGAAMPFASVTVTLTGTSTLAAIYDGTGTAIANPFTTDATGLVGFEAANGAYDVQIVSADGSYSAPPIKDLQLYDLTQLDAQVAAAVAAGTTAAAAQTSATLSAAAATAALASVQSAIAAGAVKTFASTADALSNGVIGYTITAAGTGGTNGSYALSYAGGGGSGAAAKLLVSGGALTSVTIQQRGKNYTSAPTVSFTVPGMTGSPAITAVIGANTVDGDWFATPDTTNGNITLYKNVSGSAVFQYTIVPGNAPANARESDKVSALASGSWTKQVFQESANRNSGGGSFGEAGCAFDVGTDVNAGDVLDAIGIGISTATTCTQLVVQVWKVLTTDANVDAPPPQANDVLVSATTVATSSLFSWDGKTSGITANSAENQFVVPLVTPVAYEVGKTYKITVKGLDASSAAVAIALGTISGTTNARQRRAGWRRNSPGGAFSNQTVTTLYTLNLLRSKLAAAVAQAASIASNTASLAALSRRAQTQQAAHSDAALIAQSAAYSKGLSPAFVTDGGDSLIANVSPVTTGNTATDVVSDFVTATCANLGVVGKRSDEILAAFLTWTSSQQGGYGFHDGGTNDFRSNSSGVVTATITSPGSGGTDGTYTVHTVGGSNTSGFGAVLAATYSVTVSGGAITAAVSSGNQGIGGGYNLAATLPTFDLSSIPGLTGAVVTPNFDPVQSVQINLGKIMAIGGANRMIMGPWEGQQSLVGGFNALTIARCRRVVAWSKATYGARALDALEFLNRYHNGSIADLSLSNIGCLNGRPPPSITVDGIHPNDGGTNMLGRVRALMIRAFAGIGAPYIHGDMVGARNGDALGTAIITPRFLGTAKNFSIEDGNPGDAVRINSATCAITRGAGTLPSVSELTIQADSIRKGRSNFGRIAVFRQMDGTSPQSIVHVANNGNQVLFTDKLAGAVPTKQLTIVICCRFRDLNGAGALFGHQTPSNTQATAITKSGVRWSYNFKPDGVTTIAAIFGQYAIDPYDFNFYFFTMDTTAGTQLLKTVTNEGPVASATPTSDALFPLDQYIYLFGSIDNIDFKSIWIAPNFIDVTDATNRALFYNPATKAPTDIGGSGVVAGITPIVYLRGMAGDYLLGKNYGSGGDFLTLPYFDATLVPITDLAA